MLGVLDGQVPDPRPPGPQPVAGPDGQRPERLSTARRSTRASTRSRGLPSVSLQHSAGALDVQTSLTRPLLEPGVRARSARGPALHRHRPGCVQEERGCGWQTDGAYKVSGRAYAARRAVSAARTARRAGPSSQVLHLDPRHRRAGPGHAADDRRQRLRRPRRLRACMCRMSGQLEPPDRSTTACASTISLRTPATARQARA